MAEWSSVVVVVAKSLALVCTKDQNRVCLSIWNQKKIFFSQIPKWKRTKKKKERKKEKNPKNKTEHLSGH